MMNTEKILKQLCHETLPALINAIEKCAQSHSQVSAAQVMVSDAISKEGEECLRSLYHSCTGPGSLISRLDTPRYVELTNWLKNTHKLIMDEVGDDKQFLIGMFEDDFAERSTMEMEEAFLLGYKMCYRLIAAAVQPIDNGSSEEQHH